MNGVPTKRGGANVVVINGTQLGCRSLLRKATCENEWRVPAVEAVRCAQARRGCRQGRLADRLVFRQELFLKDLEQNAVGGRELNDNLAFFNPKHGADLVAELAAHHFDLFATFGRTHDGQTLFLEHCLFARAETYTTFLLVGDLEDHALGAVNSMNAHAGSVPSVGSGCTVRIVRRCPGRIHTRWCPRGVGSRRRHCIGRRPGIAVRV
mmetsp:Transcript_29655/g.77784  ORF Transcript_29655/g.77784 Transcript_29655/m.77784 type:complete len:209 (-) Transcript_29655:2784-3410(-)